MFDFSILFPSVLNGLTTGAVYALIALGLTLIYGVLHIINFAHGACLMLALYAVYFLKDSWGIDPYLALPIVVPGMFALGYALQRIVINRAGHGKDENILLVTLGIAIVMENLRSDLLQVRHAQHRHRLCAEHGRHRARDDRGAEAGGLRGRAGGVGGAVLDHGRTDLGSAIRAVARESRAPSSWASTSTTSTR